MSIRSKAAIETLKSVTIAIAIGVGFYLLLGVLGPKLGLFLMIVSMLGWFAWLVYDYYVNKFTMEEKFKL